MLKFMTANLAPSGASAPGVFCPEAKKGTSSAEMQARRGTWRCGDEYGGMSGLVTLKTL
jgi:hypothetical protein